MFLDIITFLILFDLVKTAKILIVVPTPSISHQMVFRPLINELIKRNHELVVITTDPAYLPGKTPINLKEICVHNISYTLWHKMLDDVNRCDKNDFLSLMTDAFNLRSKIFIEQLQDKSVENLIGNEKTKFDLLILEACALPALIFSHIFNAPVIQMSSFGAMPVNVEMTGGVNHPFLYPTHYHRRLYNLSVWEKVNELYNHIRFDRILEKQELEDDKMLQTVFGINTPSLSDLKINVHNMLFLNVHPIWLHNQPVPPNVVYTWGIHKAKVKELPKDLRYYLDSSKNGVIYVSFGTNYNTSTIPVKKLETLIEVFSRLPYNVLWKWDMDDLPRKSVNIKISKWYPQCDVLKHPNVKLFITQGGLQSTDEAINAGVPLIGIPMFADQEYNTEKYAHFKIGIKLKLETLTVENLENSIKTILTNHESYQRNINQLRRRMHDQLKPPLNTTICWIEHVLRHGGARHLCPASANMYWTEYYELEIVMLVLSGLFVLGTVLLCTALSFLKFIICDYNFK